jgi:hypothetical protein
MVMFQHDVGQRAADRHAGVYRLPAAASRRRESLDRTGLALGESEFCGVTPVGRLCFGMAQPSGRQAAGLKHSLLAWGKIAIGEHDERS